jgi:hypothetical protein
MSELEKPSNTLHLKTMFGGTDPDAVRREVYYEENFPSIKKLSERGVKFYQVTADAFFDP